MARSPRPYGVTKPSYGRGPNADGFARLAAHESNRPNWYPAPGAYLRLIRDARAALAAGRLVRLSWNGESLDMESFEAEMQRALNRRINAKGGVAYSRYNDPSRRGNAIEFVRDRMRLGDVARRICVYQFESRAVRERFGDRLSSYGDT